MCCILCQIFSAFHAAFSLVLLVVKLPLRFILETISLKYTKSFHGILFTTCFHLVVVYFFIYSVEHGYSKYWNEFITTVTKGLQQWFAEGVQYTKDVCYINYVKYADIWEWEWEKKDTERMVNTIKFY